MPLKFTLRRGRDELEVTADTPQEAKEFLAIMGFGGGATSSKVKENGAGQKDRVPGADQIEQALRRRPGFKHSMSDLNQEFFPPDGLPSRIEGQQNPAYNRFVRNVMAARESLAEAESFTWDEQKEGRETLYRKGTQTVITD